LVVPNLAGKSENKNKDLFNGRVGLLNGKFYG
jgi:hypothetical protein